ncbi:endospore germination permease [Paenibacillus sp. HJGM_3]|uniref:endospore germination permease n=1 Tax=Paenibacillus sp. HJGM_3 TaxID=3379816 RepID=UPI00385BFCC0
MKPSTDKIRFIQACMLHMLMTGLTTHVIINPMLLDASGRDAWIAVLSAGVLYMPWCALLAFIMKRAGQQKLQPWLARQTNPFVSWLLVIPFCVQVYLIGAMTMLHTTAWTITNYLPATPLIALIIPLAAISFLFAISGIRSMAIGAGFMLPIVIILGYFVSISNTPAKDYQQLKPFLENGLPPVLAGMVYAGSGFVELFVMLGIQHRMKTQAKAWQLMTLGAILVYITLGPIIGAITEFGPKEAAKQNISPYEQWRLVELGNYVEHLDFFSIYQWQAGAVIRISLSLYILAEMLPFRSSKARLWGMAVIMFSYMAMSLIPVSEYAFYLLRYRYYFPIALVVVLATTSLWAVIALLGKSRKEAGLT